MAKLLIFPAAHFQIEIFAENGVVNEQIFGHRHEPLPPCEVPVLVKDEYATVKPEGSAWLNSETLEETTFRWQDVVPE